MVTVDRGYITEWLVLGPFFSDDLSEDFFADVGGEANIHPQEGDTVSTEDDKILTWKRYESEGNIIDLLSAIGKQEDVVAYAACNLLSPKDQQREMLFSSDGGGKVWLNGELIHANPITRSLTLDEDRVPVTLKKGINRCFVKGINRSLVKTDQRIPEWGFALRFIDYQGYLQSLESLELELSVRRRKPDEFKDLLSITAHQVPKSTVWTPPSLPVQIEIWDDKKLLAKLTSRTEEPVDWVVPDYVQGGLRIVAKYTDARGLTHEAAFECQAHSTITITSSVGHWETYGVTDGLVSPMIWSMVQDRNGYLWFGTSSGLCRYDGSTFRTFTVQDGLESNTISTIYEDSKGNLWLGTWHPFALTGTGVCRYDGKNFQTFTTKDGLVNDEVIAIYEDERGHMWFGTVNGLSEFDGAMFRNYTTEDGLAWNQIGDITQDKDGVFWFAHGNKAYVTGGVGTTRYDGNSFTILTTQDGLVDNDVRTVTTDVQGNLWFGTKAGVSKYDGKVFQNFTAAEGLAGNIVGDIIQTPGGDMWFATLDGVSRYRNGKFQNFTTKDGLAHDAACCIVTDREGNIWIGTWSGGVSRYDDSVKSIPIALDAFRAVRDTRGNLWLSVSGVGLGRLNSDGIEMKSRESGYEGRNLRMFSKEDGLPFDQVWAKYEDSHGNIWLGSRLSGLARYDGEEFQIFTYKDGLLGNVISFWEDSAGVLWLGMENGGIYTYDRGKFVTATSQQELGLKCVTDIIGDRNGQMWFSGLHYGVRRYDGERFTQFTTENGLPSNVCTSLLEDSNGNIWIGTEGGLCRYEKPLRPESKLRDGETFRTYTTEDGLSGNIIGFVLGSIFEDSLGNLWFGVATGSVNKFDGKNFQQFTTNDGLLSNLAFQVMEDEAGNMIFLTSKGITTYTPPKEKIPLPVFVTEIVADKVYLNPKDLIIPSTTRISFAYHAVSFKTKRMRYNYMLKGYDKAWKGTWDESVSYDNLKPGVYTFEVIAINRDLVYSEPAAVKLEVIPDPRDQQIAQLESELQRRNRELEAELQDAHNVQMSLMPETAPEIEGVEIAGRCIPANTVSGDFFDYLAGKNNKVAIVVADVCGKAMKGAMNAVMTDGILHTAAIEQGEFTPASLMMTLNNALKGRLERYMNVTMVIGMIDAESQTLTLSNAAHHAHPLLLRRSQTFLEGKGFERENPRFSLHGEVQILKMGGMPLGMMAGIQYSEKQFPLENGDVLIFMTDGIIEAQANEEQYSDSGRLEETITKFTKEMPAEAMVDAIINDAIDYSGDKAQRDAKDNARLRLSDDMTVVVAKVL